MQEDNMVNLEYFNGNEWVYVKPFRNEFIAWISLGGDNINYRVIDINTNKILINNKG